MDRIIDDILTTDFFEWQFIYTLPKRTAIKKVKLNSRVVKYKYPIINNKIELLWVENEKNWILQIQVY